MAGETKGGTVADGTERRMPTMHDVAVAAGVSHQTVSRVINGFDGIRPATRDAVLAAITELGYRRNLAARTLATSRTRAIGVLAPAVSDFGPTSTVQAIEVAARRGGYHPLVTTTAPDRASILSGLGFLLDQSVEALVVITPQRRVLDALRELAITLPTVTLQSTEPGDLSAISVDQYAGARLAVAHLLELGHRHIQHLAGPLKYFEAAARRAAFDDTLREVGIVAAPAIEGDWTAASGYRATAEIAAETTAVFSGNDQMALGLVHGLAERGQRVPDDISVVGFDDVPEAEHFLPPLTTVRQDFDGVGRAAVERLIAQLNGDEPHAVAPLEPELMVRASTAAPRRS